MDINDELVKSRSGSNAEKTKEIKDAEKNKVHVSLVRSELKDLKKKIKEMSDDEKKIQKPNEIVDIVEKILQLNN